MDEEQYDTYLNLIDAVDPLLDPDDSPEFERLRDDMGIVVPGCYRRKPCEVEYE